MTEKRARLHCNNCTAYCTCMLAWYPAITASSYRWVTLGNQWHCVAVARTVAYQWQARPAGLWMHAWAEREKEYPVCSLQLSASILYAWYCICKALIIVFCYCLYTIDTTSIKKSVQPHFQCIHDLRECVCVVHVASYLVSPPSFCMYVHVTNTEFLGTVRLFNLDWVAGLPQADMG